MVRVADGHLEDLCFLVTELLRERGVGISDLAELDSPHVLAQGTISSSAVELWAVFRARAHAPEGCALSASRFVLHGRGRLPFRCSCRHVSENPAPNERPRRQGRRGRVSLRGSATVGYILLISVSLKAGIRRSAIRLTMSANRALAPTPVRQAIQLTAST